jgi:hypothetical protein
LVGYAVRAVDGDIGRTVDFYFDDETWTVRYLVVQTEMDDEGVAKTVLLSPMAISIADFDTRQIEINRTAEQVRNSPGRETDRPVSREWEKNYSQFYRWPYYWMGPGLWGMWGTPLQAAGAPYMSPERLAALDARDKPPSGNRLRSGLEVIGYAVEASDGSAGRVEDLLVDDVSWKVHHIMVDTTSWWPGGEVLVPTDLAADIDWPRQQIRFDLSREDIQNRPEFRPSGPTGH